MDHDLISPYLLLHLGIPELTSSREKCRSLIQPIPRINDRGSWACSAQQAIIEQLTSKSPNLRHLMLHLFNQNPFILYQCQVWRNIMHPFKSSKWRLWRAPYSLFHLPQQTSSKWRLDTCHVYSTSLVFHCSGLSFLTSYRDPSQTGCRMMVDVTHQCCYQETHTRS